MLTKIRIHGKEELTELANSLISAAQASKLYVQKKAINNIYEDEIHIKLSDKPIKDKTPVTKPDFLLFMNETIELKKSTKDATDNTIAIVNSQKKPTIKNIKKTNVVNVDAYSLGMEHLSQNIIWPAMLGAFIKKFGQISLTQTKKKIGEGMMKMVEESHRTVK